MSSKRAAMSRPFNITPRAKADLQGIWTYTLEVWGEAQADRYVAALFDRFNWLAQRPQMGKHRADIQEGYYCFPQGAHLVFYLIRLGGIDVIGIPHKEMDIFNFFE